MIQVNKQAKSLLAPIIFILLVPIFVYAGFKFFYPADPDILYIKDPSLFPAKWEKVASSDSYTEFLDKSSIIRNRDMSLNVRIMRNYNSRNNYLNQTILTGVNSEVSFLTIDCHRGSFETNKIFLLSDHFAHGVLIGDPLEPLPIQILAKDDSVGEMVVRASCDAVNISAPNKSSSLNRI